MPCRNAAAWAVVADDLTGACDTGVQFAECGFTSTVWIEPDSSGDEPPEVPVLSTNTRHAAPAVAHDTVARACRWLMDRGAARLYKKLDSTLQGNIVAEIEAVLHESGASYALVVPSFPEMGRFVVDGRLHVKESGAVIDIPGLLRAQGARNVIATDSARLAPLRFIPPGALVVVDARTREDLARIAGAASEDGALPVLAGSAALAREVARRLAAGAGRSPVPEAQPARGDAGPVLLCIGSTNLVTLEQMKQLTITRGALISGLDYVGTCQALEQGRHVIVPVDPSGPSPGLLAKLLETYPVRGLVLSGGDTAQSVCRALGVKGIRLAREIAEGIPWGTLLGGSVHGLPVCTKAGGFGAPDALVRIADFLSSRNREPK